MIFPWCSKYQEVLINIRIEELRIRKSIAYSGVTKKSKSYCEFVTCAVRLREPNRCGSNVALMQHMNGIVSLCTFRSDPLLLQK
jgi:hypothetical protein